MAFQIWYLLQHVFFGMHFSSSGDIIQFIKFGGNPLVKDICLVVLTYFLWML